MADAIFHQGAKTAPFPIAIGARQVVLACGQLSPDVVRYILAILCK